jgi:isopenicillin-N epimerase
MPWRLESRYREAIAQIAPFLGARPDDLVFVPNVTTGLNAVLSLRLARPTDEVLISDLAYGAIALAARARDTRSREPRCEPWRCHFQLPRFR